MVSGLAEVGVLSLPLGMTIAVAGLAGLRSSRRREAVARAMHELRRPLQVLALSSERSVDLAAATATDLALVALDDLDAVLSGAPPPRNPRPVAARALVAGAVERWRGPAARAGKALGLGWEAGRASVMVDAPSAGRALDNLLANAIEHGGLSVRVAARVSGAAVRVEVSDRGGAAPRAGRAAATRRGHGLPIVAGIAREHGGSLTLSRSPTGTVAVLELPLAPRPALHTG
jgi:signal transduction histidine kinase